MRRLGLLLIQFTFLFCSLRIVYTQEVDEIKKINSEVVDNSVKYDAIRNDDQIEKLLKFFEDPMLIEYMYPGYELNEVEEVIDTVNSSKNTELSNKNIITDRDGYKLLYGEGIIILLTPGDYNEYMIRKIIITEKYDKKLKFGIYIGMNVDELMKILGKNNTKKDDWIGYRFIFNSEIAFKIRENNVIRIYLRVRTIY